MSATLFEELREGKRFPAARLAMEPDAMRQYWEWWWSQASFETLTRPNTVEDGDPWLVRSLDKPMVDTLTYEGFRSRFLLTAQRASYLPHGADLDRGVYREDLLRHVFRHAQPNERPVIVFVGGGYGSGKTTIFDFLVKSNKLPIQQGAIIGVDYFKAYLPEYCLLTRLCEGRASSVVQDEARQLSDTLFERLVKRGLSFGWDSSMSNPGPTLAKLKMAKEAGYSMEFVGVFAPLATAIRQAMGRALQFRRFAHPEFLPKSHVGFREYWRSYLPYVDRAYIFENQGTPPGQTQKQDPCLIATKTEPNTELAILDETRFQQTVLPVTRTNP